MMVHMPFLHLVPFYQEEKNRAFSFISQACSTSQLLSATTSSVNRTFSHAKGVAADLFFLDVIQLYVQETIQSFYFLYQRFFVGVSMECTKGDRG